MPFAVGDEVVHLKKHGRYIVERIPGQFLIQINDVWVPGYRYRRSDTPADVIEEFGRTQEDFEKSFAHARFAPGER